MLLATLAIPALATTALGDDARVAEGRAVAEAWCQRCHVIGEGDQPSALADAPSFRSLAGRGDITAEALAFALLSPHPVMPSFPVTKAEIRALSAYIDSLKAEQRTDARPPVVLAAAGTPAVERGRAIVAANCSPCHAIEGQGPSPVADAPPFSTLSEHYPVEALEEALAEGIIVNHPTVDMPAFMFEPDEIDAIIAYLEAVQEPR
jgi:mono/diheme cytochrome c family protein